MSLFQSQLPQKGWYPHQITDLNAVLKTCYKGAENQNYDHDHSPIAMVVPHAGYSYSGPCAAVALSALKGKSFDRIIQIGPSHYFSTPNIASVLDETEASTPLGTLSIDQAAIHQLRQNPLITYNRDYHIPEHANQIQWPLLQYIGQNSPIVPILLGPLDAPSITQISQSIADIVTDQSLLLISSDFIHYGTRFHYTPFQDNISQNIQKIDMKAAQYMTQKDAKGFWKFIQDQTPSICGKFAIQIMLELLPKSCRGTQINYLQSGSLDQDWSHSVSYLSMGFS